MTWLRWDTDAPFSDVVGDLSEALTVPPAHAFGLYAACCLGFGKHRPDALVAAIGDATLEGWARWSGEPGRFAAAFRARCTADGEGDDPAGVVRGWWRQKALLEKRSSDRAKRKPPRNPTKTPENPRANVTTTAAPSVLTERHVTAGDTTTSKAGYHVRCIVALNRALATHPDIGKSFREVSASEMQGVVSWETEGIPVDLVERVIGEGVAKYRPTERNRQPNSLKYFDAAVHRAWELQSTKVELPPTGLRVPRITA